MLIVSSEYAPMPAAAASRVRPWVNVLEGLESTVRVLTSKSADFNSPLVERSFISAPCNRARLIFRLIQEVFLGLDLGLRIFLKRRKAKFCLITSPPFFMACMNYYSEIYPLFSFSSKSKLSFFSCTIGPLRMESCESF